MTASSPLPPRRLALAGLLACALAVSAPTHAEPSEQDLARQALERGQVLPLRTVLDKIEREYQGQALKIEFERDGGRFIYEIRLLQRNGHLAKLKVDAADGHVLEIKRKEP
ncbi:MAG: peptidase [Candidimonas sp.]|nr:MAG: peptidase [Candidimonas sp.]